MEQTMTAREIAQQVGRDERSVRRWANKASDKMSSISDKMSNAELTKIPAQYSLDETLYIIEVGMGKNAAAIYRTNATSNDKALTCATEQVNPQDLLSMAATIAERVAERVIEKYETRFQAIEQKAKALPAPIRQKSKYDLVTFWEWINDNNDKFKIKSYDEDDIRGEAMIIINRESRFADRPLFVRSNTGLKIQRRIWDKALMEVRG